jgi:hypothetical protein
VYNQDEVLKELLAALKENPNQVEVSVEKIEIDMDEIMTNTDFPRMLNPVGKIFIEELSNLMTNDTGTMTDLQERKMNEFIGNCLNALVESKMSYVEGVIAISNLLNHVLTNNPRKSPMSFKRKEKE